MTKDFVRLTLTASHPLLPLYMTDPPPQAAGDSDDQYEEEEDDAEEEEVPQEGGTLGDSDEGLDEGQVRVGHCGDSEMAWTRAGRR